MAKRFINKLGLLGKIETAYGTYASPAGSANAVLATDVSITPYQASQLTRDLLLPYLGNQGVINSGYHAMLEFSVELAGAGVAGTAPRFGPLLKACGMSEVLTASLSAVYQPVSTGFPSMSLYWNVDGAFEKLVGARGSWKLEVGPDKIPRLRFTFTGLIGPIGDEDLPTVALTGWQKPRPVNDANTAFSLFGVVLPTESVSVDLGNQVEPRLLINESSIQIVDRKTVGSVTLEATQAATKDWVTAATNSLTGAFSLVHGTVAGSIAEISAGNVQIGAPEFGATQRVMNNKLPLLFIPSSAGNDELSLIIR